MRPNIHQNVFYRTFMSNMSDPDADSSTWKACKPPFSDIATAKLIEFRP